MHRPAVFQAKICCRSWSAGCHTQECTIHFRLAHYLISTLQWTALWRHRLVVDTTISSHWRNASAGNSGNDCLPRRVKRSVVFISVDTSGGPSTTWFNHSSSNRIDSKLWNLRWNEHPHLETVLVYAANAGGFYTQRVVTNNGLGLLVHIKAFITQKGLVALCAHNAMAILRTAMNRTTILQTDRIYRI